MDPNQPLNPTPDPTTPPIPTTPGNPTPGPTTPVPDENGGLPPFVPAADTATPSVQAATPVPPSQTPEPAASQRRVLFLGLAVLGALTLLAAIVVAFFAR